MTWSMQQMQMPPKWTSITTLDCCVLYRAKLFFFRQAITSSKIHATGKDLSSGTQ
jgi:hypothetical protein